MGPPKNPKVKKKDRKSMQFYLTWINNTVGEYPQSLFDLSDGVVYVKILQKLYPDSVEIEKLKLSRTSTNYEGNFEILKEGLEKLGVKHKIEINKFVHGAAKVKENYALIQWFHEFYLANSKANDSASETSSAKSSVSVAKGDKQIKKALQNIIKSSNGVVKDCIKEFSKAVNDVKALDGYQHDIDDSGQVKLVRASCFDVMKNLKLLDGNIDSRYMKKVENLCADQIKVQDHAEALASICRRSVKNQKVREIAEVNETIIKCLRECQLLVTKELAKAKKHMVTVNPSHKLYEQINDMNQHIENAINVSKRDASKQTSKFKENYVDQTLWIMRHKATKKADEIIKSMKK